MGNIDIYRSDFLFPTPSFVIGMGSAVNVFGNYYRYNVSESPDEADARALNSDWGVVGNDLEQALEEFEILDAEKAE